MNGITRLLATLVVWVGFVGIIGIIVAGVSGTEHIDLIGELILFVIVLAVIEAVKSSTQAIWSQPQPSETKAQDSLPLAKAKRSSSSRVARLLDDLDENEIYTLESWLLDRAEESRPGSLRR